MRSVTLIQKQALRAPFPGLASLSPRVRDGLCITRCPFLQGVTCSIFTFRPPLARSGLRPAGTQHLRGSGSCSGFCPSHNRYRASQADFILLRGRHLPTSPSPRPISCLALRLEQLTLLSMRRGQVFPVAARPAPCHDKHRLKQRSYSYRVSSFALLVARLPPVCPESGSCATSASGFLMASFRPNRWPVDALAHSDCLRLRSG